MNLPLFLLLILVSLKTLFNVLQQTMQHELDMLLQNEFVFKFVSLGLGNFFESLSGDENEVIENTTSTSNYNEKVKLVKKNWADGVDEEESLSAIDDEHVRPPGNQDVLLKLD